jgi:Fe-Mn family superoxide dismutase
MRRSTGLFYAAYVPRGTAVPFPPTLSVSAAAGTRAFRATQLAAETADRVADEKGFFFLPQMDFDYAAGGVSPFISAKQLDFQRNVIHAAVVRDLNRFTIGTELEGHSLDAVLRNTALDVTRSAAHMAAAEHFNYCFFYKSFRPWGTPLNNHLKYCLQDAAVSAGSKSFEQQLRNLAVSLQGTNSWLYVVVNPQGSVDLVPMNHGTCPVPQDLIPLLCLNLHESAYALDYSSAGSDGLVAYVDNFLKAANWANAASNFNAATRKDR